MNQQNIEILEAQRPKVELFFRSGSLVLSVLTMSGPPCDNCIDVEALVKVMRETWEPSANLNPYADWLENDGYKGFLSRLYAYYDAWKYESEIKKPGATKPGLNTPIRSNNISEK